MIYIYGLYTETEIRYVGKTNNLDKRLKEHIRDSLNNKISHKHKWIRKEIKNNKDIKIKVLEKCNKNNWEEKEKYWINKCDNLTNHTEGGEGGHGDLYSISYNDAKKIVQKLNIKSISKWTEYMIKNKLKNIPQSPCQYFKNKGWISWGDFLGTGRIANQNKKFISYNEAKKIVCSLNIQSRNEWYKKYHLMIKQYNIPSLPSDTYKEWESWGEFLGTGRIQDNKLAVNYLSYNESKEWVGNNLNIKSVKEWVKNVQQNNIPVFIYFLKENHQIFSLVDEFQL